MIESSYVFPTPLGNYRLTICANAVVRLDRAFEAQLSADPPKEDLARSAIKQLHEYFDGSRKVFELPLEPRGSDFQRRVWQALTEIPYGETRIYKDIALRIGNAAAVRAVGGANHRNPIGIIIPCHRVIGSDGNLIGYAGGLEIKRYLLDLERRYRG